MMEDLLTPEDKLGAVNAVRRGAEIMDAVEPGWTLKIDLAELNLSSSCQCVLGQIYGEYEEGVSVLAEEGVAQSWQMADSGFLCQDTPYDRWTDYQEEDGASHIWNQQYYALLDELWIAEIKKRFDEGIEL